MTLETFLRGLATAIVVVVAMLALNYLSTVLLPFFVACLLAYLLYPVVTFVQYRLHVPTRFLSIVVALVAVSAVLGALLWLVLPSLVGQFERFGNLVMRYLHESTHINNFPDAVRLWVASNEGAIERFFRSKEVSDMVRAAVPQAFSVLVTTANVIISFVGSLITLLYLFFILLDYEKLTTGLLRLVPEKRRPFWRELGEDVKRSLNSYVRGQGLVALCIGVLFCVGFSVIGFPMAIGLGILIGVLSLIPYVHGLGLIPIVLLSLLQSADTGRSFWVILLSALAVFVIVQLITDMVLTPKIMGKAMGLNPAVLLLSLSVWSYLLGFIGLIIALPATTLLIAYYKRYALKMK